MQASALLHQIVWAEMVHFAVKSGGFHSEQMISNCVKVRSSVPNCKADCVVKKLITDAFLKTFAYLKVS